MDILEQLMNVDLDLYNNNVNMYEEDWHNDWEWTELNLGLVVSQKNLKPCASTVNLMFSIIYIYYDFLNLMYN